jgi:transcriptional regulator with XRE-family HTH domain
MGLSPDQLKRIERGQVAVRLLPALFFCQFADVNPLWLAFGDPEKRFSFFGAQLALTVGSEHTVGFLEVMQRNRERLRLYLREADRKKRLGSLSIKRYLIPEMTVEAPPTWDELRTILVSKTETAKAKIELARRLGVTLAAISQFRSGASAPTADKTLRILDWIREETEAQQKKRAGSADTRPALKTRKSKSTKNEKAKSDRKKE